MSTEQNVAEHTWSILYEQDDDDVEPSPQELENYYQSLENDIIPELLWKCPGKRAPSPVRKEDPKNVENIEKKSPVKNDFDFMDDISLPQMRVRTQNSTPKGSAKKKTANFAGVIDALRKQKLSHNKDVNK